MKLPYFRNYLKKYCSKSTLGASGDLTTEMSSSSMYGRQESKCSAVSVASSRASERRRQRRLQAVESEIEALAMRYSRGRQMSEPYPDGLTAFQRTRLGGRNFRDRRLSDMLHEYDVRNFTILYLSVRCYKRRKISRSVCVCVVVFSFRFV